MAVWIKLRHVWRIIYAELNIQILSNSSLEIGKSETKYFRMVLFVK